MKLSANWTDFQGVYQRPSLQESYEKIQFIIGQFLHSIPLDKFFWKPENGWSVEQNVKHLWKSTALVSYSLSLPKFLYLVFGTGENSRDFETLIQDYLAINRGVNQAGLLQPFTMTEKGNEFLKQTLIQALLNLYSDISSALKYWKEEDLDYYRMPHPSMGFLTVREMLLFTIYHQFHHLRIVSDRLNSLNE